ncbi:tRNA pseudouridine(13) synthase TruD [Marinobacter sp.]|uniref:tRNA pseudouridine(13) synthase TruD n=1 Tax=Marinobacter sp. TaxID=50741 RepID=UPI003561653A
MSRWRLDWPWPDGDAAGTGVLKSCPEDFRVTELLETGGPVLELDPEALPGQLSVPGEGEHLLIYLEKTGDNTPWVASELGKLAGCGNRGVGYCGLKDRHAVTRQWFSVQRPGLEGGDADFLQGVQQSHGQWRVLAVVRRGRKLRTGEHQANRFDVRLRELTGDPRLITARLENLHQRGCPNYFGLQRFGHEGGNLDRAIAMTGQARRKRRGSRGAPDREGLYFSAARSWLFNEVLAERVAQGNWDEMLEGEPAPEPTGPLWGDGGTRATGLQEGLERAVVARHPEVARVFANTRMAPDRRPLRLLPADLDWSFPEAGDGRWLDLSFSLAPGQYATTLLSSVIAIGPFN